MHRRTFIRNSAFTFGALTLSRQRILSAFVQEPWKITMLSDDIGIFEERGGTIAFLLFKLPPAKQVDLWLKPKA